MSTVSNKTELKIQMLRKAMEGADAGPARNSGRSAGESGGRFRSSATKKVPRGDQDSLEPRSAIDAKWTPSGRAKASRDALDQPSCNGEAQNDLPTSSLGHSQLSGEALEVESFLAGLGLDRYVSLFIEHGFDCMEVVQMMDQSHMHDMGMATGHALKLRKKLSELNPAAPVVAPAAAAVSGVSGEPSCASQKRVSFGPVEESGGTLMDGHYDEAEQQASFQAAVRAWREGTDTGSEATKVESSSNAAAPKLAPGSFWSTLGDNEVNLSRCGTPVCASGGTPAFGSEMQAYPELSETKLSCYQCYKQFFARYAVERCSPLPDHSVRRLCSDACADSWMATMEAKAEELQRRREQLTEMQSAERASECEPEAASADFDSGANQAVVA